MKNTMIKIGTAVPNLKVADVAYNTTQIIKLIQQNKDLGILVFPELSLCGYTCADLFQQDLLLQACQKHLSLILDETKNHPRMTIAVGLPVCYKNHLYNCAAILNNGTILGIIPKIFLPNYSEYYEQRWFTSGKELINEEITILGQHVPFGHHLLFNDENTGAVIGVEICEDLWVGDKPSTHATLAGANIILNLSGSDEVIGKHDYRKQLVSQQSGACYCAYAYASSGMDESSTDLVFSGSTIIAENGRILSTSIFKKDVVTTAVIDLEQIQYNRLHSTTFTPFQQELPYQMIPCSIQPLGSTYEITAKELVQALKENHYRVDPNPFVPSDDQERRNRCKRILQIQAHGLATRVRATHIHNLVIGVSGGLDSTLAMLVCHEAQKIEPSIHIIAYTMPNHGNTSSLTYDNATRLMRLLNAECREVAISNGVNLHLQELGRDTNYLGEGDITYENAQARYRTYILMDAANMENGLVVGTGDLSELALGWCTYNGDHMSMYAVNTSIPKTLVQYICRVYADEMADPDLKDVLISICDTPISPELTPSANGQIAQKTEDKIGKYDLNDFFLFYTLRYGMCPSKILAFASTAYPHLEMEFLKDAMLRFYNRFFHQQFKRSCLPDGPKVGSLTLSPRGDWRMPSDASVALWLEEVKHA